jgi:hypothetical protein
MRMTARSFLFAIMLPAGAVNAADVQLAAGKGVTLTKAAWSYRVFRPGERQPCKVLQQPSCPSTRVEIVNNSDAELACAGQLYLLLGEKKTPYVENFGTLVPPKGREQPFEIEIDDPIDPARSFVICNTTAERDEADSGNPSFAKAPPAPCEFKLTRAPQLADYYANASRITNEKGLVRVRVVFVAKSGSPVPLGIVASSGFLRLDRGALLAASRMTFTTNCPGSITQLPLRFELTE